MFEYGKTENLFTRDPKTHHLIETQFKIPEVALVSDDAWIATEKIDGTNVRIILSRTGMGNELEGPYKIELKGRSDKASLPKDLEVNLHTEDAERLWQEMQLPYDVVVTFYGEAFGPGIQKGGYYSPEKKIAVFDLMTSRFKPFDNANRIEEGTAGMLGTGRWSHAWRSWEECKSAAKTLGLWHVPEVYNEVSIAEMVEDVRAGFDSLIAPALGGEGGPVEGIVVKTSPYLYDGRGNRVMFKLKTKDLQGLDERGRQR